MIIGRDVLLSLSAFYIRYTSLPEPVRLSVLLRSAVPIYLLAYYPRKHFCVTGTFQSPQRKFAQQKSARSHLTFTCKELSDRSLQINTALQLALMGTTTVSPLLPFDLGIALPALQYVLLILGNKILPQFFY